MLSTKEYKMEIPISFLAQASFLYHKIYYRYWVENMGKKNNPKTSVQQMLDILWDPDVHKQPC